MSAFNDVDVWGSLHAERPDVHGFMTELNQKINGDRREPRISEETHRSGAKRVKLVLGKSRGVRQCLPNVFFFEVRQVGDDLRGRHAVGDEVDDVGDGDAKAADCGSAGQNVRILRDAVEGLRHAPIIRESRLELGVERRIKVLADEVQNNTGSPHFGTFYNSEPRRIRLQVRFER